MRLSGTNLVIARDRAPSSRCDRPAAAHASMRA
jgi:hypothetical protein